MNIQISQGLNAIVNKCDYSRISKYSWSAHREGRSIYAYATIKTENGWKTIKMHRLVLNAEKGQTVDHKNQNGLDNRRSNLRLCTISQNCANARKRLNKTSIYKGVYFNKIINKWIAQISVDYKSTYLGCFKTEVEAAIRYNEEAKKVFREFAFLNQVKNTKS